MPEANMFPIPEALPGQEMLGVCFSAGLMLLFSLLIERFVLPALPHKRPWGAWAIHTGLCLVAYSTLVLLLGRPWFAMAVLLAFLLLLVLINNAKFKSLREPFVFQDYEYLTDAIRHPRLYIPFFGWGKTLLASCGFIVALLLGFGVEPVHPTRFMLAGQLGAVLVIGSMGGLLLWFGYRQYLPVSFQALPDLQSLGFLCCLWRYALEGRYPPQVSSPFERQISVGSFPQKMPLPHLVAVQSESFFDPRSLYPGIRTEVLARFDALKTSALAHGKLVVPAWGANTVRTEFAFLSGIIPASLGVQQFNPYQAIAAGWAPGSLAWFLKALGYHTVCIHPYPASFYQRHRVYPILGFDEFIDIRDFDQADRCGPYVSDAAVAAKLAERLGQAEVPTFVFIITMENHGPLHLEQVELGDHERLYSIPPPAGCDDLTIYLRHLCHADAMAEKIKACLQMLERPASLCWFGDHVPIMPSVYAELGMPEGVTDYMIWSSGIEPHPDNKEGQGGSWSGSKSGEYKRAEQLAAFWLRVLSS